MREISYQDFSLRVHNKAVTEKKRIPVNATLDLTYRCNNNCVHCYCSLPSGDKKARENELTLTEIERLFDDLRDMGCLWLLITGGEPLLRPDFKDIYLCAKRHGFIVSVFTNAVLMDDETADFLACYPPFSVEVTMYGATAETYDKVTRVAGSYDRYWTGLQRLLQRKIKVKLKTMALTINKHEIRQLDAIARGLGCEFRFDPQLHKRIDKNRYSEPEKYRISAEEVVGLDLEFPERMEAHEEFCQRMVGDRPYVSDKVITCGAGKSSLNITPDGSIMPCALLIPYGVSLREKTLKEIWEVKIPETLDIKKDFSLECDNCRLQNLCGQCTGWSFVEYGGIDHKVRYLCDIAHRRAESFPFLEGERG